MFDLSPTLSGRGGKRAGAGRKKKEQVRVPRSFRLPIYQSAAIDELARLRGVTPAVAIQMMLNKAMGLSEDLLIDMPDAYEVQPD